LHSTSVSGGAFTPDGQYLVTGSYDRLIRFWSLGAKAIQPEITGAGTTEGKIAFTLDGQAVLSQGRLFDIHTGEQRGDLVYPSFSGISADGKTAYALAGTQISIFDAPIWTQRQTITPTRNQTPYGIGISPDGSRLAVSSFDRPYRIYLLDALTGQELRTIDLAISAWGLAFSPDGQLLAAGACDTTTYLYDVATGAELRALKFPGTIHCINDVAFSPDGHYLLSAGAADNLVLWDVQTGEKVREFIGHTGAVWGVAFSRDGRYAVSGGADGTARLWDVATGKELRRFAGHTATIWEVAISPDGSLVATTSSDGSVKIWKTDLEELKTAICATLIRDLSDAERARYGITDTNPTCPGH
jgi:WD40 repeat protein